MGDRVQRMRIRCLFGVVWGEVKNSSMSRAAMENPRPLGRHQLDCFNIRKRDISWLEQAAGTRRLGASIPLTYLRQ